MMSIPINTYNVYHDKRPMMFSYGAHIKSKSLGKALFTTQNLAITQYNSHIKRDSNIHTHIIYILMYVKTQYNSETLSSLGLNTVPPVFRGKFSKIPHPFQLHRSNSVVFSNVIMRVIVFSTTIFAPKDEYILAN